MQEKPQFRLGDLVCVMHFKRIEVNGKAWFEEIRQPNGTLRQPPEMYVLTRNYDYQKYGVPTPGEPMFSPLSWLAARHFARGQCDAINADVQRLRHLGYDGDPSATVCERVFLGKLPEVDVAEIEAAEAAGEITWSGPDFSIARALDGNGYVKVDH